MPLCLLQSLTSCLFQQGIRLVGKAQATGMLLRIVRVLCGALTVAVQDCFKPMPIKSTRKAGSLNWRGVAG
jgi:hypothetical protein